MADKRAPKTNVPIWKKILIMIVSGSFGAAAVMPIAPLIKRAESPFFQWLRDSPLDIVIVPFGLILMMISCFIVAVGLHEVGHVIAGTIAGFRFAFLLFWPFQIRRRGERGLSFKTMFRTGLGMGGLAGMTPEPGIDLRRGFLTLLAGGPAASLAGAVAGIGSFLLLRNAFPLASAILWCFGICSFLLFMLSMNPSQAGGFLSDGAAIRLLRKGSPERVGPYLATMEISSAWSSGTRPADWNASAIERVISAQPDDPLSTRAPYFAFLHEADKGNLELASFWMDKILETIDDVPMLLKPQYRLMNAWLKARQGLPADAREQMKQTSGGLTDPCDIAMVEAVILQAEGKIEEARTRARESISLIGNSMMPDSQSFARHQCEAILA